MAVPLLVLEGQSGEALLSMEPPEFDNFIWDAEGISIDPEGEIEDYKDGEGDDVADAITNTKVRISGTVRAKSGANQLALMGWLAGKGVGATWLDVWFQIRKLRISNVIRSSKKPAGYEIELLYSVKRSASAAADVGIVDLDA